MYAYTAFFSYKRDPLTDEWHREVMTRLTYWLSQNLGYAATIFFDTRSIGNGAMFDQAIAYALKNSPVIVSLMSPMYFTSPHCLAEIGAFVDREDRLQRTRGDLISCARFHDGANYPLPFAKMQSDDFAPFANPAKAFWKSEDSVKFELVLRDFAGVIASKVKAAPTFDPGFPEPPYDPNAGVLPARILRPAAYLGGLT